MRDFDDYLKEQLRDHAFACAYVEELHEQFRVYRDAASTQSASLVLESNKFREERDEAQRELAQLRAPLTLEKAVEILNKHKHEDCDKWLIADNGEWVYTSTDHYNQWDYQEYLPFTAIAIAEKYLREGK